jgi:hypothetical protein
MGLRIAKEVAWQSIGGEAVLVDLERGRTFGLNATGSVVWSLLADHDEEALAAAVAERFDTGLETARADVREFLRQLRERGLVVEA